MDISTATALATGANRGFGRALADELLARGATVHAAARNPAQLAADAYEILADDLSRDVRAKLSGGVAAVYPPLS
ncbi:SDR family NAD(P)-dependent oxidoreductase [Micromonospora sp. BQ11]|uniref:SDR family NAD(P)-dependent oxidoreductase n=1 Tax=Micromonospora sp. BQ11 TaxID=3452212 RepID=UPI003F8B1B6C